MRTIIAGARADGHAKVVLEILQAAGHEVIGFLDDDLSKKGQLIRTLPVLGSMDDLSGLIITHNLEAGIAAIGHNAGRRALAEKIKSSGLKLISAIHPTVHLDSDVKIGDGTVLCQGVIVVTGTVIGDCVNIHTGATIDHDNYIEDGANLGPGCHTAGRVKIGQDCFLGTGTVVIPDITIEDNVETGAGTVVIRNLKSKTRYIGVPATILEK